MPRTVRAQDRDRLDEAIAFAYAEAWRAKHVPVPVHDPVALSRLAHIEPDPWQAGVLLSSSDRLLLNCCRQSGKSTTVATLAVHTALYQPESLVLLVSPSQRQSGELFRKCAYVYVQSGRLVRAVQSSALQLHLENGSRIISLPGKEETIRGYSGVRLLVLDEGAWVEDDLYLALRPMLGVSHGRLIGLSTPHGKRGWYYRAWKDEPRWEKYEISCYQCPRLTPEFLEEEREAWGPWLFPQEYENQFVESESQMLTEAQVDAAFRAGEQIEQWALT